MTPERTILSIYYECLECGKQYPEGESNHCQLDHSELIPVFSDTMEGTMLNDKYQILVRCGSGASGSVYRARHVAMNKDVAIKFLHPHLVSDEDRVQQFEREARTLAEISHPHIVKVVDYGLNPQPYIVMEFHPGKRLDQILQSVGAFPLKIAVKVFIQICEGMAAVHERSLVHQDLKPSNILVAKLETDAPEIRILDFGTARLLVSDPQKTGAVIGSPPYMSPEQCGGQPTDPRSDVYSLGCIMYEVITGKRPFSGTSIEEYIFKHLNVLPEPPSAARPDLKIPPEIDRIILRALSKDVNFRLQSMNELATALKSIPTDTLALSTQKPAEPVSPPWIIPGLVSTLISYLVCCFIGHADLFNAQIRLYFSYVWQILGVFSYVYWIICLFKLDLSIQKSSGTTRDTGSNWKFVVFLLLNSPPAPIALAVASLMVGPNLLGSTHGAWICSWLLLLLVVSFSTFTATRYFFSHYSPLVAAILVFSLQVPSLAVPVTKANLDLSVMILFTCWTLSYVCLVAMKTDLVKATGDGSKTKSHLVTCSVAALLILSLCAAEKLSESRPPDKLEQDAHSNPRDPDTQIDLGWYYNKVQDYQSAISKLKNATALAPGSPRAWRLLATTYYNNGRYREALECVHRAQKVDIPSIPLLDDYDLEARAYEHLGDNKKALVEFGNALKSSKSTYYKTIYSTWSALLFHKSGDYQSSIKLLDNAISLEPDWRLLKLFKARSLLETGRYDEAIQCCKSAEGADNWPRAICLESIILLRQGQYGKALSEIDKVAPKLVDWSEPQFAKAIALAGVGRTGEAIELARQASNLAKNEDNAGQTAGSLARVYLLCGDYEQAMTYCRQATQLSQSMEFESLQRQIAEKLK